MLALGLVLLVSCARLPQVELELARSEVAKAYAGGAKVLAVEEYEAAAAALHEAELAVYDGDYRLAHEFLELALIQATKASALAKEKAAELEARRQARLKAEAEARAKQEAREREQKRKKLAAKPAPKPKPAPPKPRIVLLDEVTVAEGETLFSLAGRKDIYGDSFLWPLIYKANRDQIKDPLEIFGGQVFTIPRDKSEQELAAARREARESGLFLN